MKGQQLRTGISTQDSEFIAGLAENQNNTSQPMTAFAGGGQAGATQIQPTTAIASITVVATGGDSVRLPAATAGKVVFVHNTTANSANVFAQSGNNKATGVPDVINQLANGTALACTTLRTFVCGVNGFWGAA